MEEALKKYHIIDRYEVHWGDMDAAQHVNNLVYLKWAESGRLTYFEKLGLDVSFQAGEIGPILGWQECKYIFPMTYPDVAITAVRTLEVREDRFILECAIFSEKHQRIACISKQSIIPYDYGALRKAGMPEDWVRSIEKIERV